MARREIDPVERLRAFRSRYQTGKETAEALRCSESYLSDMLRGRRDIPERILAQLGLRWTVVEAR